ncbi:hypothetical protein CMI42_03760 [Candidatus Pacearchaeota archaeon]|nr:hypothetical protein [Candidatus Pacearchaeota archaeon]|tara:strand:- start:2745 stop:3182 length:438 start_codon:yes stop_codon:yes gene_type:complete
MVEWRNPQSLEELKELEGEVVVVDSPFNEDPYLHVIYFNGMVNNGFEFVDYSENISCILNSIGTPGKSAHDINTLVTMIVAGKNITFNQLEGMDFHFDEGLEAGRGIYSRGSHEYDKIRAKMIELIDLDDKGWKNDEAYINWRRL